MSASVEPSRVSASSATTAAASSAWAGPDGVGGGVAVHRVAACRVDGACHLLGARAAEEVPEPPCERLLQLGGELGQQQRLELDGAQRELLVGGQREVGGVMKHVDRLPQLAVAAVDDVEQGRRPLECVMGQQERVLRAEEQQLLVGVTLSRLRVRLRRSDVEDAERELRIRDRRARRRERQRVADAAAVRAVPVPALEQERQLHVEAVVLGARELRTVRHSLEHAVRHIHLVLGHEEDRRGRLVVAAAVGERAEHHLVVVRERHRDEGAAADLDARRVDPDQRHVGHHAHGSHRGHQREDDRW